MKGCVLRGVWAIWAIWAMPEFRSVVPEPESLASASQASRSEAFGSSSEEEAAEEEPPKPVQASKSHSSRAVGSLHFSEVIL